MDLNLLKVFISVADNKSISLASNELKCSQSNATSRVKQLEKILDTELFYRVPKGVILTNNGELFYPQALEIVHKMENSIKSLKNENSMNSLKIGSTDCNAAVRISPFLLQLHNDFPNTQLELFTGTTKDIYELILDYKVDIAFISGEPKNKNLKVLKKFEEEIAILEPKKKNVPNVTLTFKEGCVYDEFLKNYYKEKNIYVEKSLSFGNLETILSCIKVGMGKSLLPLSLVRKMGYDKDIKITILPKSEANIPTCLVCRVDNIPKISDYLKEIVFD
ncbi:LysR family transcriptional regulator [Aliarcobacter thereius]|uniref:HTH-type transcriptional regulator GltR n=2 Tax=Aliarcobacter thereius TaxID=544718 RepID=A0A1C0BA40_9BACT|nr:LysR substrate-binding domain-containing protein [Aliarcobacter thereius]OCL91895.1 HTH-type transcriptional regulator GltR [Aliarcobacter thereius]OCL95007.1 HTH-type transcriptional regulator GltR [Aliarcobacter thereius LMG 24486]OCM00455.1 HTH-type transcriptional regulator GltR [Aliarcobacter thereius]QBF15122.1 transcriptional regulator, LysR family [Aliarcobacter thereius LMG 24486]TLS92940.1 LysR family transcriptional regulator [Aliarcobacter thereius]